MGEEGLSYKTPRVTVDIIIEIDCIDGGIDCIDGGIDRIDGGIDRIDQGTDATDGGIVMIERANPPHGWALPGGFVDYGEVMEKAAKREAKEETSLDVTLIEQFHTYSAPDRDPRHHTISTVFIARARGNPRAADDAQDVGIFLLDSLPNPIVFDHQEIIDDYTRYRQGSHKNEIFADRYDFLDK